MINGELISLSVIEKEDLLSLQNWRNNSFLKQFFREHSELSYTDQLNWYEKLKDKNEYFFCIRLNSTNELIGVVGVNYVNWINRTCQLSIYIGKENLYIDENGWAKEAVCLIESYAFETLHLNKIFCEVYEFDNKKLKLLTESNYSKEGELRKHIFKNGKYYNSVILSKIKE